MNEDGKKLLNFFLKCMGWMGIFILFCVIATYGINNFMSVACIIFFFGYFVYIYGGKKVLNNLIDIIIKNIFTKK